ncbi:MAG: hypothetical protein ABSC54_03690 [Smithellaceae bacterium]|jgi:hypothetical protein
MIQRRLLLLAIILNIINLISCGPEIGQVLISRPDEYRRTFEAKENFVLQAIAGVFRDKNMGINVTINKKKQTVETDFIVQDDWRTRSSAYVRKLNWKESEVFLSVITEKKTEKGWEMRRLLNKEQYDNLFEIIELKIYEEMANIE